MADNKKYYYMRLKDNFFDTNELKVLQALDNGYIYSDILLKLYLMSLKDDGKLMLNDRVAYNSKMLATITRHSVEDIESALQILQDLGLIEILDNGAIYMLNIQNFIGQSSTEADRKKKYRRDIEEQKNACETNVPQALRQMSGQMSLQMSDRCHDKCPDKRTPEIEIEKEIDIEINKKKDIKKKENRFVKPTPVDIQDYVNSLGKCLDVSKFYDYYEANGWIVGKTHMKDWKATVRNWIRRNETFTGNNNKQQTRDNSLDDYF